MTKDLQGSSHHLKVVGGAYGKRKDFIYEKQPLPGVVGWHTRGGCWGVGKNWLLLDVC